jgi:hypothetical protein
LIRDSGNPTDPVELMMLEQIVMTHLHAAQLQGIAAGAEGQEFEIYSAAAIRMLAEFRKSAVALATYRQMSMPAKRRSRRQAKQTRKKRG